MLFAISDTLHHYSIIQGRAILLLFNAIMLLLHSNFSIQGPCYFAIIYAICYFNDVTSYTIVYCDCMSHSKLHTCYRVCLTCFRSKKIGWMLNLVVYSTAIWTHQLTWFQPDVLCLVLHASRFQPMPGLISSTVGFSDVIFFHWLSQ